MDLEPSSWQQRPIETDTEYGWFTTYLELGDARSVAKVARRLGASAAKVQVAADTYGWDARVAAWERDSREVAKTHVRDEEVVHSIEYQVGMAMIRMGMSGLEGKNPHLLAVPNLVQLMREGAELARKGSGAADMVIEHRDRESVGRQFAELLGEEWEDGD